LPEEKGTKKQGNEYKGRNEVKVYPQEKEWVEEHKDGITQLGGRRIKRYFLRENKVAIYGILKLKRTIKPYQSRESVH